MPTKTLLLIDFLSLAYPCFYKMPRLASKSGMASAVAYGVLGSLNSLYPTRFPVDEIILCMDSRHSRRKEIFPDYKAKRKKNDCLMDFIAQVNELRQRLPDIGLPCASCDGYESDDIIAVLLETKKYTQAIVCSSDNDLHQLVSDRVFVWDLRQKKTVTPKTIYDLYGFKEPVMVAVFKALAGCSSDEVPGLKGWGKDKKVPEFMKRHSYDLDSMVEELKELGLINTFDFMLRLVLLPLDLDYKVNVGIEGTYGIDRKALVKMFTEYSIERLDAKSFML